MAKAKLLYWVDVGLFFSAFIAILTGILKFLVSYKIYSITFHFIRFRTISLIHDISGIVMTFFALVHIVMHWNWIVGMTKSLFKKEKNK